MAILKKEVVIPIPDGLTLENLKIEIDIKILKGGYKKNEKYPSIK